MSTAARRRRGGKGVPRGLLYAYWGLGTVSGLIVLVYLAWQILVPKPGMAVDIPPIPSNTTPAETGSIDDVTGPYQRQDDCWTFLLIGKDKVGANTDSLMLLTYDVGDQTVNVASIPRDTKVDVDRRNKKINAAFANGGIEGLEQEVSQLLGIPIDYYIKVDVNAFVALIDAVKGIDFYVPCDMDYDDPWQDLSIHYKEGMQHLNGQQALEVCRFRHNNDMSGYSDTGRMETQRGVLTAVAQKVLSWGNITRINEFVTIISEHVETDLSLSDMAWFASQALSFQMENLNTVTLPAEWRSPYMYLDPEGTLEIVNQYLNPYTTDRTADQLNIVTK